VGGLGFAGGYARARGSGDRGSKIKNQNAKIKMLNIGRRRDIPKTFGFF
jgi:hypothetical protein